MYAEEEEDEEKKKKPYSFFDYKKYKECIILECIFKTVKHVTCTWMVNT